MKIFKWLILSENKYNETVNNLTWQTKLAKQTSKQLEKDIKELIKPLVDKFLQVKIVHSPSAYDAYRLCLDFDGRWIEQCFEHGNSEKEMEYIAQAMSRRVEHDIFNLIKSRNIVRRR